MPLRVLYCIDSIHTGGTETQLVGLINRLDRRRFEPLLCTLEPSSSLLDEIDVPHLELGGGKLVGLNGYRRIRRLAAWIQAQKIDLVQTFFQDSSVIGISAAKLAGVDVRIVSFRDLGFWRQLVNEFLMRRIYPFATGFIVNSDAVKNDVCRRDGLDPDRVRVIPNGIDLSAYDFAEHLESEIAVGIVGNLNRRVKRQDLFLKAAARISSRYPGTMWHVIGDGGYRAEYEALARDLGIDRITVFPGQVADVASYLRDVGICVSCSDSEGLSNAMLEAMLGGCTIVASAVGGNLDLVHDGETGLLVPPDNEIALATALDRLLSERILRLTLAMNARAAVEQGYGWDVSIEAHQSYYEHEMLLCGVGC